MILKEILLTAATILTLGTTGCSNQEITGKYKGYHTDGDGGISIRVDDKFYTSNLNPDTLEINETYKFDLRKTPLGDYIDGVKPSLEKDTL